MDPYFLLGMGSAVLGVGFVWARVISSISRITEVAESHIGIKPLVGRERSVPMTDILELELVSILGFQTHATISVSTEGFWSLAHNTFRVPVRGRFIDQQGSINDIWRQVPSKETRL